MKSGFNDRIPVLLILFAVLVLIALVKSAFGVPGDGPLIAKDTIRVKSEIQVYSNPHTWYPALEFQILGPLPSGAILWAEFGYPAKKSWVKMDCETRANILNKWEAAGCYTSREKAVGYVGPVDFTIHLRNEIEGTDQVLYKGKFKVVKTVHPASRDLYFHVDEDWRIPIGYLYFDPSNAMRGLHAVMWFKGKPGGVQPFLFYKGKEVVKGSECGAGGPGDFDPKAEGWWEVDCEFPGAYENAQAAESGYDPKFDLSANPGEYEIKALAGGKLARVLKFTVRPDGTIDDAISVQNNLGRARAIVPVELVGNQGIWDQAAWRTGAYYGQPLAGFTAPPPRAAAGPK